MDIGMVPAGCPINLSFSYLLIVQKSYKIFLYDDYQLGSLYVDAVSSQSTAKGQGRLGSGIIGFLRFSLKDSARNKEVAL